MRFLGTLVHQKSTSIILSAYPGNLSSHGLIKPAFLIFLAATSILFLPEYANAATESLWSASNSCSGSLTLNNSANADGSTTGSWASCGTAWTQNNYWWEFNIQNSADMKQGDALNSVTLKLKHYNDDSSSSQDDTFNIEVWDGTQYKVIESSGGYTFPHSDTTEQWDVTGILNTFTKIQAAKVRVYGVSKAGAQDSVNWYMDTVELSVAYTADATPPGAVTSLEAATDGPPKSKVTLSWLSPGNDLDTGTLSAGSSYYIQYSLDPDASWNYTNAQIIISAAGVNPKSPQTYIPGTSFGPNKTYYFRLWTADGSGNFSDISNIATRGAITKRNIDGDPEDWPDRTPVMDVNTATTNDWIWNDKAGDERTDAPDPDAQYDIKRLQVTADSTYVYFLVEMSSITSVDVPHIALSVDTDQNTSDTGLNWFGDDCGLGFGTEYSNPVQARYPEFNLIFHSTSTSWPTIEISSQTATDWYAPRYYYSIQISTTNRVIEAMLSRDELGISGSARMRLSCASFRNIVGRANSVDTTEAYAGNDALDAVSSVRMSTGSLPGQYHNDAQNNMNAWDEELSNNDLDFCFDIPLTSTGAMINNPPDKTTNPVPASASQIQHDTPLLTWTAATDPDPGDAVTCYMIELATHTDLSSNNVLYKVNVPSDSGWEIPAPLQRGATYYWRVLARDTVGVLTSTTSADIWSFVLIDTTPPSAVSTLSAQTGIYGSQINVSWQAPGNDGLTDPLTDGSLFHIATTTVLSNAQSAAYWNARGTTTLADVEISTSSVNPGDPQQYVMAGLAQGVTYYMRIWTRDSVGNWSDLSNAATAYAKTATPAVAAPSSLSAQDAPNDYGSKISLSWVKSADDGGGDNDVQVYRIYRATWSAGQDIGVQQAVVPGGTQSYQDATTSDGTTYYYVVRAWNGLNDSPASNEANAFSSSSFLAAQTTTYTFASGGSTNKYYSNATNTGETSRPPATGPALANDSEITNYTNITSIDTNRDASPKKGGLISYHHFKFAVAESTYTIGRLHFEWVGYNDNSLNTPYLFMWNFASSTWTYMSRQPTNAVDVTLPGDVGIGFIDKYIDSSGYCHMLVEGGAANKAVNSNFFKLDVTKRVAPAAITVISALTGPGDGVIGLTWTSPGSDGWYNTITNGEFRIEYSSWTNVVWSTNTAQSNGYYVSIPTSNVNALAPCSYKLTGLTVETTYYFRVWTKSDSQLWSDVSSGATTWAYISPAAITTLSAVTPQTIGQIALSWQAPGNDGWTGGITGGRYRIDYATWTKTWNVNNYAMEIPTGCSPSDSQSCAVTGLNPNNTYYFYIWTKDDKPNNWSALSNGTTISSLCNMPQASGFTSASSGSVTANWQPNYNPGWTRYLVECSSISAGGAVLQSSWTTDTGYNFTDLSPNCTYYFRVKARNNGSLDTDYAELSSTHTLCADPAGMAFTATGNSSVSLQWSANGNSDSTEYELEASTGTNAVFGAVYTGQGVTFVHQGLLANATYYYRARAKNLNGLYSGYSAQSSTHTRCNTPGDISFGSVSQVQINLSWQPNGNSDSTVYTLESSSGTNTAYQAIYASTSTSYGHGSLTPNVTYYYRVCATNLDGFMTGYGAPGSTYTLCNVPGQPQFAAVYISSMALSMQPNGDSGSTLYGLAVSTDNATWNADISTGSVNFSVTGLDINTTYYYKVKAKNLSGIWTDYSGVSSTSTLCNPPAAQAFTELVFTSVTAHWSVNFNPGGTRFLVECSSESVGGFVFSSSRTINDKYTFTDLYANTTYYCRVKASNNNNVDTAWVTLGSTATLPLQITGFMASSGTYTLKTRITWDAFPGCTYKIYRSTYDGGYTMLDTTSNSYYDDAAASGSVVCGALNASHGDWYSRVVLSVTNAACVSGTTYYYKVSAVGAAGEGPKTDCAPGWGQGTVDPNGFEYYYAFNPGDSLTSINTSTTSSFNYFSAPGAAINTPGTDASDAAFPDRVRLTATGCGITAGMQLYYKAKAKTVDGLASGYTNEDGGYRQGGINPNGYDFQYSTSPSSGIYYDVMLGTCAVYDFLGAPKPSVFAPGAVTASDGLTGPITINSSGAGVTPGATYYYRARYRTTEGNASNYSSSSGGNAGYTGDTIDPQGYDVYRSTTSSGGPYYKIASSTGALFYDHESTGIITAPSTVSASDNQSGQVTVIWSGELVTGCTSWYKLSAKGLNSAVTSELSAFDQGSSVPQITKFSVWCDTASSGGSFNIWVDSPAVHTLIDSSLGANSGPRYYKVKSFSPDTGWTALCVSTGAGYTLAAQPAVNCVAKSTGTWYNSSSCTFTNQAGWSSGGIDKYKVVWDTNTSRVWAQSEADWTNTGDGLYYATSTLNGSWYMHLKSYNKAGVSDPSLEKDIGPYNFDDSSPTISIAFPVPGTWYTAVISSYTGSATDTGGSGISATSFEYSYNGGDWTSYSSEDALPSWKDTDEITQISETTGTIIQVRVRDKAGNTAVSDTVTVKVDTSAPSGIMSIGFGDITQSGMKVTACALTDVTEGGTFYRIICTTTGTYTTPWQVDNSTACAGMQLNKQYSFKYSAKDGLGNTTSDSAVFSTCTLSAVPAADYYTNVSSAGFSARWAQNSNPSGTEYYCEISSVTPFAPSQNSGWAAALSYSPSTLLANCTYWARVKSRNFDSVETDFTGLGSTHTLCAVPGAAAFSAVTETGIGVSWASNNNSGSPLYELAVSSGGSVYSLLTVTTSLSYPHSGLAPNCTYYYKVRAKNIDGIYSDYSSVSSTHTLCNKPVGQSFTAVNVSSVTINWDKNNNTDWTVYGVYSSSGAGSIYSLVAVTQSLSYTHQQLTPNVTYYYKVRAINADGIPTDFTSQTSTHTLCALPGPVNFTSVTQTGLTLQWPHNGNSGSTPYELVFSTDNIGWQAETTTGSTDYNDAGLDVNRVYYYRIRARNLDGLFTQFCQESSTATLCNLPLAQPLSGVLVSSATASWQDNSNPPVTEYRCEVSSIPSVSPFAPFTSSPWTVSLTRTFENLPANTTCYFGVKARNQVNTETDWVTLGSTVTLIQSPSGLVFGTVTDTSIRVAPAGVIDNLDVGDSGIIMYEDVLSTDTGWRKTTDYWLLAGLSPGTTYYFSAKTRNLVSKENGLTGVYAVSTKPEQPLMPDIVTLSTSSIRVVINPGNNHRDSEYAIKFEGGSSTKYVQPGKNFADTEVFISTNSWGASVDAVGLTENTSYSVSINVRSPGGEVSIYGLANTTYTLLNPPVLSALTLTPCTTSVMDIQVTNPANASAGLTGSQFECTLGPGGANSPELTGMYSYFNDELSANTEYGYRARYKNAYGNWTDWTAAKSIFTKIELVMGIEFGVVSSSSIEVMADGSFSNLASGDSGLNVYELTTSTESGWYKSQGAYRHFGGLAPNTTYDFGANSRNSDGLTNAPFTTVSTCTLANEPVSLGAAGHGNALNSGTGYAELSWGDNFNPDGTIYELYCVTNSSVIYTGQTRSFTHVNLEDETSYYYKVRAKNHLGLNTAYTSEVPAYMPDRSAPGALAKPSVTQKTGEDGTITVTWAAGPEGDIKGYKIYYATFSFLNTTDGGVTFDAGSPDNDPGAVSFDVDGLSSNVAFYFAVAAIDKTGNENSSVTVSNPISPTDKMPPARILNLTCLSGSVAARINLAWTAPGDNGMAGQATRYIIKYADYPITELNFNDAGTSLYKIRGVAVSGENPDSENVTGLIPGKYYYFAVQTEDDASNFSPVSNSSGAYAYIPLTIVNVQTVDDDQNGRIDAYRVTFSTDVDDSSLVQSQTEGFDVQGYSGETFASAGLPNSPDAAGDNRIYISFNEGGSADTYAKPELVYSASTGKLKNKCGFALSDAGTADIAEQDNAGPIIISAIASDSSGGVPGIQTNDKVQLVFSENTNIPAINKDNVDTVLLLSNDHSWRDGIGEIVSAEWIVTNILEVKLAARQSVPTIVVGDTITVKGALIKDGAGNVSTGTVAVAGDFGKDITPPTVVSRETADLNKDGFIDALKIVFNEPIKDSTVQISSFVIAGVTDESFASDTNGDLPNDSVMYITFKDGALATDKTPTLTVYGGALSDMTGNPIVYSQPTPSSDKAAPVIISAEASDGVFLAPGVDGDDTVTITFSEETIQPNITSRNIGEVFVLSSSHTWGDVRSAAWNESGDTVKITFGDDTALSSINIGDTISIDGIRIKDLAGNGVADSEILKGSFIGVDNIAPYVVSTIPVDKQLGVGTDTPVEIIFSENMDLKSIESAVSMSLISDKDKNLLNQAVDGTCRYDAADNKAIFTPAKELMKNSKYEVCVSTAATDTIGNGLVSERRFTFDTVIDCQEKNVVVDDSGRTKLIIEPGTISSDFTINVVCDPLTNAKNADPEKIRKAITNAQNNGDSFCTVLKDTIREINLVSAGGTRSVSTFEKPITIEMSYYDSDRDGMVDNTKPSVRAKTLALYYLDEKHSLWVRMPGSVIDPQARTVTVQTKHFSVFAVLGNSDTNLADAYAFPVPYIPSNGDKTVTFTNLSSEAEIKIFTMNGELVKTINHDDGSGQFDWDVTNNLNEKVASGVYLYIIKNAKETKKGKLMVIR